MGEPIPEDELQIEELSEKHKELFQDFKSDTKELKDFLVNDALDNQESGISNTYVYIYKTTNKLVAYLTLFVDVLELRGTTLRQFFKDKGIKYPFLPALKVGRLCVHEDYKKRRIGTYMMNLATRKLLDINLQIRVGCRFLIVDSKKEAVDFYMKWGFEILEPRKKGAIPMYSDMIAQIKLEKKQSIKTT